MDLGIPMGPARELIYDGMELAPSEGSELAYTLAGYSGAGHIAGNLSTYREPNPHTGSIKQDIIVTGEIYKKLKAIQNSGRSAPVVCTTAGGDLLIGTMMIGNADALENANGTVSLELAGNLSVR